MKNKQKKILIAEDEEINYLYLSELLEPYNYDIIRAENGLIAVEKVKDINDFIFILMDIRMPLMDGVLATKEIKKIYANLPVIAQTAYDLDPDTKSLFDEYIPKPIFKTHIDKIIEKYDR